MGRFRLCVLVSLVLAVAAGLSGCGRPAPCEADCASTTGPASSPAAPAPTATTRPSADPSGAAGDQPVSSRSGSVDYRQVTAELYPVQRHGETAVVNVRLVGDGPFRLRSFLNDGDPRVAAKDRSSPDGVRLIDPSNGVVHLAATTADGSCICSPRTGSEPAQLGQSIWWVGVTFAAPPAEVDLVDVQVPGFGTFSGVPLV